MFSVNGYTDAHGLFPLNSRCKWFSSFLPMCIISLLSLPRHSGHWWSKWMIHQPNDYCFCISPDQRPLQEMQSQDVYVSRQWFSYHTEVETPLRPSALMTLITTVRILHSDTIHVSDASMSQQLRSGTMADLTSWKVVDDAGVCFSEEINK